MMDLTNTYVIAEIGVNHNGSIKLAKEMISAAKAAAGDQVAGDVAESVALYEEVLISLRTWTED